LIGVGPDDGERPEIFAERQQATGVLEEDDRFPRRLAGELAPLLLPGGSRGPA